MRAFALIFALGCGSSAPPTNVATPPAPSHPSDARCKQAAQHLDELAVAGSDVAPEQRDARLQAVEQARAAGILGGDRAAECAQQWTDAVVDCVLGGSDKATANACIPAK